MSEQQKKISAVTQLLANCAQPLITAITYALPLIIAYSKIGYDWYVKLPKDHLQLLIGTILCFFGGVYPTLFAAIEAAKHGGLATLQDSLKALSEEAIIIIEASKKDDNADEDKNGIKDVKEISNKELIIRKTNLVLVKMDPQKVDVAISSTYKVWLSVVAVLTLHFARTISLAVSISDFVKKPLRRYVSPIIEAMTPDEYDKWVPIILGWLTKGFAMSIAWYIQAVISAVTSAMTGALMISRTALSIARKNGWTFGGLIPDSDDDTAIDEYTSYVFAFIGCYVQFKMNFDVPFPMNLILFPFEMAEYFIRWTITKV